MRFININQEGKVLDEEPYFASGTSKKGWVEETYNRLVEVFGEPNGEVDGYKVDVQWIIFTPVGVATIYNWKNGHNYNGEMGHDVEDITDWHIGGKDEEVVDYIVKALKEN